MKIISGKFELYSSGILILPGDDPIDFTMEDLLFRLIFDINPQVVGQALKAEDIPGRPNSLAFRATNYIDVDGAGLAHPIKIGTLRQRELFFVFRVFTVKGGTKTIDYTFYLGQNVN